jgi:hypothetical protein
MKGLFFQEEDIGRQKDGRQVKPGTSNHTGLHEAHGPPPSAPPQQVISALMADQTEGQILASAPLKKELE